MPPHPSPSGSVPFIKCGIVPPSFLNHFGTEKSKAIEEQETAASYDFGGSTEA